VSSWNPNQYLKFEEERTRPCQDLVNAVQLQNPRRIIDLGCGPGNSTQVLMARWPDASITGLDNSEQMIAVAKEKYPHGHWLQADIDDWQADEAYDLVFSNAALQRLPNHAKLFPHLLRQVKPGGVLAFQMPVNKDAPANQLMRNLATSENWRQYFPQEVRDWHAHDPTFYYEVLSPHASRIDLWRTEYFLILSGAEAIVEWYKGTGLRPFLGLLPQDMQARFLNEYLQLIKKIYLPQPDSRVIFPFLRSFVIAYRADEG